MTPALIAIGANTAINETTNCPIGGSIVIMIDRRATKITPKKIEPMILMT